MFYVQKSEDCLEVYREGQKKIQKMRKHPIKNKTFQYIYAKCYPETFVQVEKHGINLANEFLITFKAWKGNRQKAKMNLPPLSSDN